MKKSELLNELRKQERLATKDFTHYDTLGLYASAKRAEVQQCKFELLADLLEQHIEDNGDESITDTEEQSEGGSIPATDPHKDDETYMPFDTDLGKGFM